MNTSQVTGTTVRAQSLAALRVPILVSVQWLMSHFSACMELEFFFYHLRRVTKLKCHSNHFFPLAKIPMGQPFRKTDAQPSAREY
jgi:hypothetical protein